ncbi:MAG: glycosyltransferase [Lentisphaerae bacterium]|nr:glycosyltransferase [Lentisphaerota bacterium]
MTSVSVVIPVYNEEASLEELIRRTLLACNSLDKPFEIILINDGSRDKSDEIIAGAAKENEGVIIGVSFNRNYGQHSAVMAGFAQAKGDIIVTLDADLQNPPEEIPKVVAAMEPDIEVVGTVRIPRCDTFFRRISSSIVNKLTAKTTGVEMHDYGCMLRGYRRNIVEAMLECRERSTFIPALANSFAQKTTEIEVQHSQRTAGTSKYSLWKLINLQFDLMTSITTFPLRLLSIIGVCISLLGIAFAMYLLLMRLIMGPEWAAEGVFTLFAILFFFVGAQFVAMGVLGEYLGRMYIDVRARPRYFIRETIGHSKLK